MVFRAYYSNAYISREVFESGQVVQCKRVGDYTMKLTREQITDHFSLSEFDCNGSMILTPEFANFAVNVIEPFRVWYNRPININSGYRTAAKNKAVGGDYNSLHLTAMAIDFNLPADCKTMSNARMSSYLSNIRQKWFALCKAAGGHGQMTVHNGWLHLGMSANREYYDDRR